MVVWRLGIGGISESHIAVEYSVFFSSEINHMPALLFETRGDIAYLTLNRPEVHNAINPELMVLLAEAWRRIAADHTIRVAIITGAGDKAFSAGADLARLLPLTTRERAPEARRLGLINHVVPAAQVMAKAEELARKIAANGPLAVRAIKQGVARTSGRPLEEGYQIENEIARAVFSSEDAREGPRAFREKRKPNFQGK
jgi:enoyl-CoA hydratase/carnithine racemase